MGVSLFFPKWYETSQKDGRLLLLLLMKLTNAWGETKNWSQKMDVNTIGNYQIK